MRGVGAAGCMCVNDKRADKTDGQRCVVRLTMPFLHSYSEHSISGFEEYFG